MITPKYIVKSKRKKRIRNRLRSQLVGTASKPRLMVTKTNKYLYAQVFDDEKSSVILTASTLEKELRPNLKSTKDKEAAKMLGELIAKRLKEKKIKNVIFDRNVYLYAGRVKIIADTARENGIKF
jgi:large subunit ribosomal protein L18